MMKKVIIGLIIINIILILSSSLLAAEDDFPAEPFTKQGEKWRIGYCETGPYPNYAGTLYYLLEGFAEYDWLSGVNNLPYSWGQEETSAIWQRLSSAEIESPYLNFVEEAYYSLTQESRSDEAVLKELTEEHNLDLIIVMGTKAGKVIATAEHSLPTMVFSTSNAQRAGIVEGVEKSAKPHIWAHMAPERYKQQLEVFYDIFEFDRLGIVYEDSVDARTFAAVKDVKTTAAEKGFAVVESNVQGTESAADQDRYYRALLKAHQELAPKIDALYYAIAPLPGLEDDKLDEVLTPFYKRDIPVFSQLGQAEVERGALMSLARSDFKGIGLFGADRIIRVLNGREPGTLSQVFENTPALALNLEVAEKIGYQPPFEILLVTDKIYFSIKEGY